jgi:hypothetical protein
MNCRFEVKTSCFLNQRKSAEIRFDPRAIAFDFSCLIATMWAQVYENTFFKNMKWLAVTVTNHPMTTPFICTFSSFS